MRKIALLLAPVLISAGCSSTPNNTESDALTPETAPDKVLARINDMSNRPSWLNEEKPFDRRDGSVIFLGQTTIPGDHRVEAGYAVAENNAKGSICGSIESRLDFVFQNAEEGTGVDANQVRRIGAEACKITSSSIRPGNRYWEKVATTTDTGERVTRYRIFATVTMPEGDFKRSIMEAIKRQRGQGGISQDFAKKVDQHWEQLVNGGGQ